LNELQLKMSKFSDGAENKDFLLELVRSTRRAYYLISRFLY
jgi:hypothetical protein